MLKCQSTSLWTLAPFLIGDLYVIIKLHSMSLCGCYGDGALDHQLVINTNDLSI